MDNKEFIQRCKHVSDIVLSAWNNGSQCYEVIGKKQFCLTATHNWGNGYCDWSWCKKELFNALKEIGATNISGEVKWNRIRIYFNKKKMVA